MKKLVLLMLVLAATGLWARGMVGPELTKLIAADRSGQLIPVNIILNRQINNQQLEARCRDLRKAERWSLVTGEMKSLSARTQQGLLAQLQSLAAQGLVADIMPLWIVNGVFCRIAPDAAAQLAARPEVNYVEYSLVYTKLPECITPETFDKMVKGNVTVPTDAVEWNVQKVGADSVWHLLGYTGDSVIVGHIDTGINYNHMDFAGHLWSDTAYPHNGWDFENGDGDNIDISGHGTHTAGTVSSNGAAGDTCGMAPRSQVMTCRVRTTADSTAEEQVFQAMQFCVAPPLSPAHHAQCITMSLGWEIAWNPRQATWRQSVANVSTAGLPFLIAAGNERGAVSPPNDLRCPGNVPGPWKHPAEDSGGRGGCISIAATDNSDNIASFSSQGPVSWSSIAPYNDYAYPPGLIHPDVGAPGVNVTSCAYNSNNGYLSGWSGTSMATPCVAGTVALMLEKNPELLPRQADSILQMTVKPLGAQPKNNDYGTGRISAYAAVQATPFPFPQHDVRADTVLMSRDTVDTVGTIQASAIVRNLGNREETFPLILRIGVNHVDTVPVVLAVGQVDTVDFPPDSFFPRGIVTVSCTTACDADTNPSNNRASSSFLVIVYDVAADSLLWPSPGLRMAPGLHISPRVRIKNPGTQLIDTARVALQVSRQADFSDTFWARDTLAMTLVAGSNRTVHYPEEFIPIDTGAYYERLVSWTTRGRNSLNDTISAEFFVGITGVSEAPPATLLKPRILPSVVRGPYRPGSELNDVLFYDVLGRHARGLLAPGIYYLMAPTLAGHHKLLVLN